MCGRVCVGESVCVGGCVWGEGVCGGGCVCGGVCVGGRVGNRTSYPALPVQKSDASRHFNCEFVEALKAYISPTQNY